jgi:molybdate/tungstate transport system permease protein
MIPAFRNAAAFRIVCGLAAACAATYGLCCCFWLRPFDLLNVLLCMGMAVVGARALLANADLFFSAGAMTLMAAHVLAEKQLAPDNLTSGAILLTGILVLYVGLKVQKHLSRWHFGAFVAGYFVLYLVFVVLLQNAEPLFILYLLGLAAAARSLRLTAYFWAIVVSFSFCQPYAWESLVASCFLLTALFGARGTARSATTLLFLGCGLVLVLSLLFPILTIILSEDVHSLEVLLRDPRIRAAIGTTLATATVSTLVLIVGVTPLAYALARLRFPGRELLLCLIDLPIVIPQSAAGIALVCLLGRKQFLGGLLADQFGVCFDGTVLGICLAQTFVAMPFFSKSALAAFQAVDEELEAVAGTLGAPPWSVFWRVALPLASRGVAIGAVLALARAAGEFGALLFLAPTPETAPIAVFNRFNSMGIAEVAPLVSLLLLLSLGMFLLLQLATRLLPSAERRVREANGGGYGGLRTEPNP